MSLEKYNFGIISLKNASINSELFNRGKHPNDNVNGYGCRARLKVQLSSVFT